MPRWQPSINRSTRLLLVLSKPYPSRSHNFNLAASPTGSNFPTNSAQRDRISPRQVLRPFEFSRSVFEKRKSPSFFSSLEFLNSIVAEGSSIRRCSLTEKTRKTARNRIRDFHNPIGGRGGVSEGEIPFPADTFK